MLERALFKFSAKTPAEAPLFQLPPRKGNYRPFPIVCALPRLAVFAFRLLAASVAFFVFCHNPRQGNEPLYTLVLTDAP